MQLHFSLLVGHEYGSTKQPTAAREEGHRYPKDSTGQVLSVLFPRQRAGGGMSLGLNAVFCPNTPASEARSELDYVARALTRRSGWSDCCITPCLSITRNLVEAYDLRLSLSLARTVINPDSGAQWRVLSSSNIVSSGESFAGSLAG
ncbi:hypothetical protein VTJ04DRAFT_1592 [Mycothermus thermophilus]|uniref:uncharacterized protein n=1 Tax=Humicola insolens TaxID=85995 RepID=UPI003743558D